MMMMMMMNDDDDDDHDHDHAIRSSSVSSWEAVGRACELLGVTSEALARALSYRTVTTARAEAYEVPLNPTQVPKPHWITHRL
jgi:myosin heavy subunit